MFQVHYCPCWNMKWIVSGASVIFVSSARLGDYHSSMNGENL